MVCRYVSFEEPPQGSPMTISVLSLSRVESRIQSARHENFIIVGGNSLLVSSPLVEKRRGRFSIPGCVLIEATTPHTYSRIIYSEKPHLLPWALKIQIPNQMGIRIQIQTRSFSFPILLSVMSMSDKGLASTLFLVTREF